MRLVGRMPLGRASLLGNAIIQTPEPSPGVYWPIDSNGKVNYGYDINGADADCRCGGGSLAALLFFGALGALGYAVGAAVAR